MSVINQMLKDLEQRTPEQGQVSSVVPVNRKPSTMKIVVIALVVLLSINALGFYILDLQTRVANSELKAKESVSAALVHQPSSKQITKVDTPVVQKIPQQAVKTEKSVIQATIDDALASQPIKKQAAETPTFQYAPEQETKIKDRINQPNQDVAFVSHPVTKQVVKPVAKVEESVKSSQMTVSRRQLTTAELVTQKLVRAEKAINTNQITTAEKLFEEVLILAPSNQQARKKLAALWFGRKSYQQAVNLLSQGIALDKQNSNLRMLKAQIQLKQGQYRGAYHTLKALPELEQQDYQLMLANVAQQIEAYQSAITAYKILIKMQPYSGKWHLGLAIVYDKSSQFTLAGKEYALALSKNDLSSASAEFATQRMQALGE